MFDQPHPSIPELLLPEFRPGWVWLAGAGPGDPGLLTLNALHALRSADIILHDALVDSRILSLIHTGIELILTGKRGGQASCRQEDITERLIEEARRGRRVLRLKGGDPMMFGRGAEELQALVEAGIRFRIVPGISSGLGGLAYAGIPLTCRGLNEVVTFVTGHDVRGKTPESVDWLALGRSNAVLVLFMAVRNLRDIVPRLLAGGRSPEELVAIVRNVTCPEQEVIETTLGACVEAAAQITPPALVVVGKVVGLRQILDPAAPWLETVG